MLFFIQPCFEQGQRQHTFFAMKNFHFYPLTFYSRSAFVSLKYLYDLRVTKDYYLYNPHILSLSLRMIFSCIALSSYYTICNCTFFEVFRNSLLESVLSLKNKPKRLIAIGLYCYLTFIISYPCSIKSRPFE